MMVHSTASAMRMRVLLNASGGRIPVANFTTMKFSPQMRDMHSSSRSVTERPDGTGWAG